MANRIIGVDLGAYSVKIVVTNPGFRQAQVAEVLEAVVPEGEQPHLVRAAALAGQMLAQYQEEEDSIYTSMSGDRVFLHVLDFEFKSLRRSDLENVVGAELEGILPVDLEDMVYAFEQIPKLPEAPSDDSQKEGVEFSDAVPGSALGKPMVSGLVASPTSGMRILAAASQQKKAEEFLFALRNEGVDPKGLLAAPAPYAMLATRIAATEGEHGIVGIIDIGHMRTDFCISKGGKPIFARSIARGGHHVTRQLAKGWNCNVQQAMEGKHSNGFIASRAFAAQTEEEAQVSQILAKEVQSLLRDLKRTLQACRAKTGFSADKLILVGGGSRLRGLSSFLSEGLYCPVELLNMQRSQQILGDAGNTASLDSCALAMGVAMDGASAKPSFDLRQGELAYKGDKSFLAANFRLFAVAAVAIMAFGVFSAKAGINKLRSAEEILDRRVALESAAAFGEQLSASDVLDRVGPVKDKSLVSPIPSMTGYDMLIAFNQALPKNDKVLLNVREINIEPGKIEVKASSSPLEKMSALDGINKLKEALRSTKCFKDFKDPESQPSTENSRQFNLTIKSDCNK